MNSSTALPALPYCGMITLPVQDQNCLPAWCGPNYLGDCERWAPLVLQDVQADAALAVYVGVVHLGLESNLQGSNKVRLLVSTTWEHATLLHLQPKSLRPSHLPQLVFAAKSP